MHLAISLNRGTVPTVKFDTSRVTDTVKAEIKRCVGEIEGPTASQRAAIYNAALRSVMVGRDLHILCVALMDSGIEGMTKKKAAAISMQINNRTTSIMNNERQQSLGIEEAQWLYSGAPCMANPKQPTATDIDQDKAHLAANGKRFRISQGMFLNGKWTWPGDEDGCRCASRSIIPGLE